jgi:hypothetical protein
LLAIIVALLPFLVLASFNHPSGDNFCYTNVFNDPDIGSVLDGVIDWRRRWNGRYFALFLMGVYFTAFDMIETYRYPPLVLFASWCLAGYYLLRGLTGFSDNRFRTAAAAVGLCAIYVLTMPLASNGFYHVTGAFQYQAGNILTLAVLGCLLRISSQPKRYGLVLLGTGLLFSVVGSTELHMVLMVNLIGAMTLYGYWVRSPTRHAWVFLLIATLLSTLFLFMAPGNEGRGEHFLARHQFWYSTSESILQLSFWLWEWTRQPLLWLGTFAYLAWLAPITEKSILLQRVRVAHLIIGLACLLLTLLGCFFVAYWTMGVGLPGRALNVAYFIFLVGWLGLFGFGLALWKRNCPDRISAIYTQQSAKTATVIIALATAVGFISAKSTHTAYADLTQRAQNYDESFRARYNQIQIASETNAATVIVPAIKPRDRPRTIMVDDIRDNRRDFRNECYAAYFRINAISAVRARFSAYSPPVLLDSEDETKLSDFAQYVFAHKDLRRIWSKSDEDIDQWGRWHWTKHGERQGRLFAPLEEITTVTAVLQPEPSIVADHVGCGVKDLDADGKPDLVLSLDIEVPESAGPISAITSIKLRRSNPAHIYQTNDKNPPLGVGLQRNGPLLNNSNGRIQLANPARNNRLWLFACADGKDQPGSLYWAEFRLRRDMP